ncbi:MAG: nicotinate-nucleotide adenylyltransferase [Cytophagales bacterium]|nr:nicotinate-nucleotide adenylyltransferase [Cytophagales bacterium]
MEIGLYFGSFNPIHNGHLIIAQAALELAGLDEIWFVVSPQNPFKKNKNLLHEFDRYDMVRLAIEDNDRFRVSDIEFDMPKPSYTIDTLVYLKEKYPDKDFKLIIGGDNLSIFPKWKNSRKIIDDFGLIVYPRPGVGNGQRPARANITYIDAPLLDISATYVRKCIRESRSIAYMVPEKAARFIYDRKLYL